MKKLIVYGTQYGTTKRYAEKFSEIMDIPCISYEEVKALSGYDVVIHFGGLYAGGVKGLKATIKSLPENTRLIIVTVGLADVSDEENINNIRRSIRRQVPARVMDNTMMFHLRGGIDYKKLNFKHKTMMTLLYFSHPEISGSDNWKKFTMESSEEAAEIIASETAIDDSLQPLGDNVL